VAQPPCRRRRARPAWRGARDETGAVTAELVVATPVLLVLILCVVQFAIWEHACHVADAVANQGLATARLQGESTVAGVAEARSVLDELGTAVLGDARITATRDGAETSVVVTGDAESVIGLFHLPVRAVASGPTEAYTVPGP
jgi:Flp pilus assembly protein TadG